MAQEFLPLCDVLFNIISLASYFCDIVFDVVTVYTLYAGGELKWFVVSLSFIMMSLLISQVVSLNLQRTSGKDARLSVVALVHLLQCGVLWRYFKLFLPVDLSVVKREVRDLCLLRLIHAFCEAAPMLLVQLFLIWMKQSWAQVTDLNMVSTLLSLFSVCWALASFSKNVRRHNLHKLVLTWLGVIFQFLWRLGTVSSRVVILTVYATLYHHWVFLVIFLHWITMLLWLISPKNVFHGEVISLKKKIMYSMLIAYIYIFCYINLQEINSRQKMFAFYITMFLENTLLMAIFLFLNSKSDWFLPMSVIVAWGGFLLGIVFMVLYYRFFHIQHLKRSEEVSPHSEGTQVEKKGAESQNSTFFHSSNGHFQNGIPGVFNCRLNPALKRKKKKPSSFIPPPLSKSSFWKRPKSCGSDHESSVGSRVNIQQKLQEKKKQQLQELKEIEEEIKQGKLKRPKEMDDQCTLHQPIPHSKKQPWGRPDAFVGPPVLGAYHSFVGPPVLGGMRPKSKQRSQTPEILLIPDTLDSSRLFCDYREESRNLIANAHIMYPLGNSDISSNMSGTSKTKIYPHPRNNGIVRECAPSDLDSQISLPRSYTLPREFRYYRRPRQKKPVRSEHFVPSNNSSDGDVDSADDNETYVPYPRMGPAIRFKPYQQPFKNCIVVSGQFHETKL